MTALDTSPRPPSSEDTGRPTRLRRVALGALVLAVVAAVVAVGWTWRHPTAFEPYGGWGVGSTRATVGETMYVGVTYPDGRGESRVHLHGATPHGVSDSADSSGATFDYYLCTHVAGASYAPIGVVAEADFRQDCADPVAATDAMAWVGTQQLVVAITPTRAGTLVFHGFDLDYSDGWQDGAQWVGGDVSLLVSPGR
ncbi:hypothetical protein H5V45_04885 [Nocardioides sp. KIGAM211]|uniref:Uncharacterized protein n=1 Tax=Nocardioides luti TaxID=2761101 RepID=A0A7X0VB01_9ACTN|nr:hypothetical protein [Nocardioides luti]MBB6626653.1 hypothetical protein [Nocardioides luti]